MHWTPRSRFQQSLLAAVWENTAVHAEVDDEQDGEDEDDDSEDADDDDLHSGQERPGIIRVILVGHQYALDVGTFTYARAGAKHQ